MPKAMDFTSISMRVAPAPPGLPRVPRVGTSKSGLAMRALSAMRTASRGYSRPVVTVYCNYRIYLQLL
jgi:hypothetical protein